MNPPIELVNLKLAQKSLYSFISSGWPFDEDTEYPNTRWNPVILQRYRLFQDCLYLGNIWYEDYFKGDCTQDDFNKDAFPIDIVIDIRAQMSQFHDSEELLALLDKWVSCYREFSKLLPLCNNLQEELGEMWFQLD